MPDPNPPRRRKRRWIVTAVIVVLMLALVVFLGLPWLLGTGPGRSRVALGLNQALAPGQVEFDGLHLSWFGPIRLSNVRLLDPNGKTVVTVPSATYDKTLGQFIVGNREPSTLSLDGASLEIERSADGSIDLVDALQTLIDHPNPRQDLTIRIDHGSLRYRDPILGEPAKADDVTLKLHLPPSPSPMTWLLDLAQGESSLEIRGDLDRWLARGGTRKSAELQLGIVGHRWPFVAQFGGVDAAAKLDGSLDFARKRQKWVVSGDAKLLGLDIQGKSLAGDSLVFDRLEAGWDLAQGEEGWTIRRLSIKSPVGDLKAEGQITGAEGLGKQRIEGRIDLAEIARRIPHALRLREGLAVDRGSARLTVDIESSEHHATYDIEARVSDLSAKDHDRTLALRDPATFTAHVLRDGEASSLDRLEVKTSFLEASARGKLVDGLKLEASFDLDKLKGQLADWMDLGGLELAGRGSVSGTYKLFTAGSPRSEPVDPWNSTELAVPKIGTSGGPLNLSAAHEAFRAGPEGRSTTPVSPTPRFENSLKANFRDLRVGGVDARVLPHDGESLELRVDGEAESSGWPRGWDRIDAWIGKLDPRARVRLESKPGAVGVVAYVTDLPIPIASTAPRDALLKGEWAAETRTFTIELARVEVGSTSHLEVFAKGLFDLSKGELTLEAASGGTSATIAPGVDGIHVSGIGRGLADLRVEGSLVGDAFTIDARLSDWSGRAPLGLSGRWSAIANARGDADGLQVSGKVGLVEASGNPRPTTRPTSMAVRAHYSPKLDRVDLSEFTVSTPYGTLDASGNLQDVSRTRKVELIGKLSPDFAAITALLVQQVEPGAKLDGKPRGFRASGNLDEASGGWKGLEAEFGFDLTEADIYGMKFGASPVVLRSKNGKLSFDPISTTLNEGHVRLEPELDLEASGGPVLRLAKNSAIRDARINDEVSKRVLAFVAPVLDQTTRASGFVSVDLDHAEFPIGAGRGRQAKVEGAVVFQDVEFAPGPLAGEILGAIGRRDLTLRLDQPVTLTIADGRINQRGMSIPIADLTRIELAGWVDFDKNLSMVATVPVTPAMLGNNPLLSEIAAGTKVRLPIGGSLSHPTIDRDAFTANLQDMGKSLLTRGATRGAMELLMRMARPKDPDAPPPPPRMTPEERKAQRQQKKAIRRGEVPTPTPEEPR